MYSQEFKTKTILQPRNNPSTEKYWGVAIDVGYSAVKVFSPNIIASFPSYAQKVEYGYADRSFGNLEKTFIAYRDENKNEYYVGAHAQNDVKVTDSNNSTAALYVRDRWSSPETKVITRVGLALGMMKNQFNDPSGKILHVQTGLPAEYMSMDMDDIKSVFIGHHEFMIKLGSNNWMPFSFDVLPENFAIMPQPMGTLVSVATDKNGGSLPEASKYFSSNLLIMDPGFGTLDTFNISNHFISTPPKTWDNLGMLRVLQETQKLIKADKDVTIPIPAMQKILGNGYFMTKLNKQTMKRDQVDITPYLSEANKNVCKEAIDTINGCYNFLQDMSYLVITGGTGAAWLGYIQNFYKEMDSLKVIDGAANDTIPAIFSNVRGYYMQQLNNLKNKK